MGLAGSSSNSSFRLVTAGECVWMVMDSCCWACSSRERLGRDSFLRRDDAGGGGLDNVLDGFGFAFLRRNLGDGVGGGSGGGGGGGFDVDIFFRPRLGDFEREDVDAERGESSFKTERSDADSDFESLLRDALLVEGVLVEGEGSSDGRGEYWCSRDRLDKESRFIIGLGDCEWLDAECTLRRLSLGDGEGLWIGWDE